MTKHNNMIPDQHFRKDYIRRIKTWFDQPAKKQARRAARVNRAKKIAPRPLDLLRPAVHCPTIKYNSKVRAGRGFTLDELRAAGISPKAALGIGIAVDHRRTNKSEEQFNVNVQRLKAYQSKLVVYPRKSTSQRIKKGDASKADWAKGVQVEKKHVLPIEQVFVKPKARLITKEEKGFHAAATLRKTFTDSKLWGVRDRRIKLKAEKASAGGGKGKKTEDAPAGDD